MDPIPGTVPEQPDEVGGVTPEYLPTAQQLEWDDL